MSISGRLGQAAIDVVPEIEEGYTPQAIAEAIAFCGPALVARYVCHQAKVCLQSENVLAQALRRYCQALESGKTNESESFSIGDQWSGLLWWRDEASWVGRVGVFSRTQVEALAVGALRGYLELREAGRSHQEIAHSVIGDSDTPQLAQRLMRELVCDGHAPGLRAVISHAAGFYRTALSRIFHEARCARREK